MVASETPVIAMRNIVTRFGRNVVHDDISVDVAAGEIVAIIGGSGSGKTTLMREMSLLLRPSSGEVRLFGETVQQMSATRERAIRCRLGMMFQRGALFSSLSVAENIAFPIKEYTQLPNDLIQEIVQLKLALVGLPQDAGERLPEELSGGMVKRAAMARSLALDPALMFLDEPTAGLDPRSGQAFDDMILQLRDLLGLTIVLVSHDLETLWRITDRVILISNGKIAASGPIAEVSKMDDADVRDYFEGVRQQTVKPWNHA